MSVTAPVSSLVAHTSIRSPTATITVVLLKSPSSGGAQSPYGRSGFMENAAED